jgi:hypothetical protein
MRKHYTFFTVLIASLLFATASYAQQTIAQPYYDAGKIRFYNKDRVNASSPCYTLDLSADINTAWGTTGGINAVVIYQSKLFVSIDDGNGDGGVLVYNYADVYPSKTAGPVSVLKPENTNGLPVAGITVQPGTGDLYIGTFYTGASDAGIYKYTAASGYTNASVTQVASYNNDNSIDKYIANLAFDGAGNLWFTEFDAPAAGNQFLVCFKGNNKNNYYKIVNTANKDYSATPPAGSGTGTSVYLLSQPEGITFDASGNLWLGNNNDDYAANNNGDGTLVRLDHSWINGTFLTQAAGSASTVPLPDASVFYIAGGKLGGLYMDADTLYINDQGQNQGTDYTTNGTVWKYTINATFDNTNFFASGIHTTYPGNGLMALDNSSFSIASDCVNTGISNITQADEISLSPVPAPNKLVIHTTVPATITITNVIGEKMQQVVSPNQSAEVNTTSFAPGVYFATLHFADGTYTTRKFVKE